MSLGAGLSKIGGPSLERKDFGRSAEDDDTFCGMGTVGEQDMSKVGGHSKNLGRPKGSSGGRTASSSLGLGGGSGAKSNQKRSGGGGLGNPFGGSAFGNDEEDSDEEDLFADANNPFRMPSGLGR